MYFDIYCKIERKLYNISIGVSWERKYFMSFNGKHLSLEDRKIIEQNICKGLRKFETAKELNKIQSTIGKEIKNIRKCKYSLADTPLWNCNFFKIVWFVLTNVLNFKKFLIPDETVLLVLVIVALILENANFLNTFTMLM